jgi:NADPH:quinone reductase
MEGIVIEKNGGHEVLQYRELPDPEPVDHEVLIENQAIGVNYIDIYHRTGLYPKELPFVPGLEGSGIIKKVGGKVFQWKEGDHVAYNNVVGAYASKIKAPEDKIVQLPGKITHEIAAAIMLQGLTAHYLSRSTYPLKDGDTCLILAAAGGVGLLLTQMAKICGAFVIGAVSTKEKAELCFKAGADEVILYAEQSLETEVKRITNGKGVNVIYDSVGKDTFDNSLNCLSPLGYMVLFGQSSGPVPPFDPIILNQKGSLFLTRPTLFHYIKNSQELKARADDLFCWVIEDKIKVRIDRNISLKEAAKAHQALENRETSGKVILIP